MRSLSSLFAALLLLAVATQASATELELGKSAMNHLRSLPRGGKSRLMDFRRPRTQHRDPLPTGRDLRAGCAYLSRGAAGQKELPRSNRTFLRGYANDGSARVAMSLNADGSFADGNGSGPDGSFVLHARIDAAGTHRFTAQALEDALPPGYKYDFRCGNEGQSMLFHNPEDLMSRGASSGNSPAVVASSPSTFSVATVAVDTDKLFMSQLFSNNTTNAANWIAKMFNTMNTMYEPDLNVVLAQGTTFLRVGSDPYSNITVIPADRTDLDKFGTYWNAHYGSVKRAFATLLSGRGPCSSCGTGCVSCSASGIA